MKLPRTVLSDGLSQTCRLSPPRSHNMACTLGVEGHHSLPFPRAQSPRSRPLPRWLAHPPKAQPVWPDGEHSPYPRAPGHTTPSRTSSKTNPHPTRWVACTEVLSPLGPCLVCPTPQHRPSDPAGFRTATCLATSPALPRTWWAFNCRRQTPLCPQHPHPPYLVWLGTWGPALPDAPLRTVGYSRMAAP